MTGVLDLSCRQSKLELIREEGSNHFKVGRWPGKYGVVRLGLFFWSFPAIPIGHP